MRDLTMIWMWVGFISLVATLLALDLGVFHRKAHVVGIKEALAWTGVWMSLAFAFALFVFLAYQHHWAGLGLAVDQIDGLTNGGRAAVTKYLTAYVLEKSLSVDNIFVISLLFVSLGVPTAYQHRVLFWGILGAVIMRGAMIGAGVELIARYHWILYVFGVFLIGTAIKMLLTREGHADPSRHPIVRLARKILPVTEGFHGSRLIVSAATANRSGGRKFTGFALTPLALALIAIEASDLLFAVDSIPAVFAITADPFLVFTSNIFAILGLRSLYFALAGMMAGFRYLKVSLSAVLAVVGAKMLLGSWLARVVGPRTDLWLLGLILIILAAGAVASLRASADPAAQKK